MPLPDVLAALIERFGDDFQPNSVRDEYNAYAETWRLYLDLLEMDSTKLGKLLEQHSDESAERYALRQKIAAVFNYVPSLIRMTINYLHSDQPIFDTTDERLKAFITNCDGSGRSLPEYIRREALPLALIFGFIDTLIQNPATDTALFQTAADSAAQGESLAPRAMTITPLQRMDWSCRRDHAYNWLRFRDHENENPMPFLSIAEQGETFVTVSAFLPVTKPSGEDISVRPDTGEDVGFWVKSWRAATNSEAGGASSNASTGGAATKAKGWEHDGDFLYTKRCPIATLYYQQSIDPERRHHGISKVAMIAILTRKIIQLLSWSDEDVLSNLAIFVMPGEKPKDALGKDIPVKLTPFTILWLGNEAKLAPSILQGDVDHIRIKWEIIDNYIKEILRLAFLIGASAESEVITSGVQGVVARNELFQELGDVAGACDIFALDILALAASYLTQKDVSREAMIADFKVKVTYNKGPYTVDPLDKLIANTEQLIATFADISPTMVQQVRQQLAQAALYNEDDARATIFDEIAAATVSETTQRAKQRDALTLATQTAASAINDTANNPPANAGSTVETPAAVA